MVFGRVVDATGNWTLPFAGAIGFLVLGTIMAFRMRPDRGIADILAIGDSAANPAMSPSS
jgi:cyanate permease